MAMRLDGKPAPSKQANKMRDDAHRQMDVVVVVVGLARRGQNDNAAEQRAGTRRNLRREWSLTAAAAAAAAAGVSGAGSRPSRPPLTVPGCVPIIAYSTVGREEEGGECGPADDSLVKEAEGGGTATATRQQQGERWGRDGAPELPFTRETEECLLYCGRNQRPPPRAGGPAQFWQDHKPACKADSITLRYTDRRETAQKHKKK